IQHQKRIKILSVTTEKSADLAKWYTGLKPEQKIHMNPANKEKVPEGTGYIFTLQGVTYYTDQTHDPGNVGVDFVVNTLVKNLESPTVTPPKWNEIPVGLIGISHPALLQSVTTTRIYDPDGFKAKAAMTNLNKVGSTGAGIDGNYGYSDPMESSPMPT